MTALDDKNPNNNLFIDKNGNIDNDVKGNNDDNDRDDDDGDDGPLPLILL